MKVHLVDGTYELFRSFFGAPPSTAPDGREVGATRGILQSLWALLRADGVTHVAAAFDQVIESFRNELYAGYKTGEGIDPLLWAQFPLAERASHALGIVTWPMVEFEADDALATAAARWADAEGVEQITTCSTPSASAQRAAAVASASSASNSTIGHVTRPSARETSSASGNCATRSGSRPSPVL